MNLRHSHTAIWQLQLRNAFFLAPVAQSMLFPQQEKIAYSIALGDGFNRAYPVVSPDPAPVVFLVSKVGRKPLP